LHPIKIAGNARKPEIGARAGELPELPQLGLIMVIPLKSFNYRQCLEIQASPNPEVRGDDAGEEETNLNQASLPLTWTLPGIRILFQNQTPAIYFHPFAFGQVRRVLPGTMAGRAPGLYIQGRPKPMEG